MKQLIALCFLAPAFAEAQDLPTSLQHWKDQARVFWDMDFSNEDQFKTDLKAYYAAIYRGPTLARITDWIDEGSLGSGYYASHYGDLRDTDILSISAVSEVYYVAQAVQNSCYALIYDPPDLGTIVDQYKVTNLTQRQVDSWLSNLIPDNDAEICLRIERTIKIVMSPDDRLIEMEEWSIDRSTAELKAAKPLKSKAVDSGALGTPWTFGLGID